MIHPLPKYFLICCALCLSACTQNPQPLGKPLPNLTYEHLNPYRPYGGGVHVVQSFQADKRTTETAKEFPISPEVLLQKYAYSRFDRYQRPLKLVFDVQKVALTKKSDADNIVGFLSGAAENSYLLDIAIALTPIDQGQVVSEPFTINMKRELFLPQRLSIAEREFRQFEFLETAMTDIDKVVTQFYNARMQ